MNENYNLVPLGEFFTKDEMAKRYLPLAKWFYKSNKVTKAMLEISTISKAYEISLSKNYPNKQDMATLCFSIFYNAEVFKAFISTMPSWFGKLVEKLLWQKTMHRDEVEKLVGYIIVRQTNYGDKYEYISELGFFDMQKLYSYFYMYGAKDWQTTYKAQQVAFLLPQSFKNILVNFYPKPAGYYLTPIDVLEENDGIKVFNAEAAILQEFSTFAAFYFQGNIKYSVKGRPSFAGLRKTQRTLALKEFYEDDDAALHPIRTMLVAGMLFGLKPKDILNDTPATIKKIFTTLFTQAKYPSSIAKFIFNQIKGINHFEDSNFSKEAAPQLWDLMKILPQTDWITWQNMEMYINTHFIELQPLYGYSLERLSYEVGNNTKPIDNSNRTPMLHWTFAKGFVFLFAAFGLVEISVQKPNTKLLGETWFSEYDGLQALKLTALGRYVLGKSSTYEPPIIENANKLVFDGENLIIRAEGNLNLMTTLLGNYVEKISSNRFAFRPALFVKDCKNIKQIQDKISLFRKSLNIKLPNFWEMELEKLITNAKAVTAESDLLVFKLNEQDKHLLRTIAQDNQLKTMVIKAERFYILLASKNKQVFKSRLLELGYFVEL